MTPTLEEENAILRQALEGAKLIIAAQLRIFQVASTIINERLAIVSSEDRQQWIDVQDESSREAEKGSAMLGPYYDHITAARLGADFIPGSKTKH